jgi:hypothetical protein
MDSSPNLAHKLNEYNKLVEIFCGSRLGSMKDEMTFNNLTFMKTSYETIGQHILMFVFTFLAKTI